jgi:hypothetical protein
LLCVRVSGSQMASRSEGALNVTVRTLVTAISCRAPQHHVRGNSNLHPHPPLYFSSFCRFQMESHLRSRCHVGSCSYLLPDAYPPMCQLLSPCKICSNYIYSQIHSQRNITRPPLWSSGQSSWLQNGNVLCFL